LSTGIERENTHKIDKGTKSSNCLFLLSVLTDLFCYIYDLDVFNAIMPVNGKEVVFIPLEYYILSKIEVNVYH